MNLSDKMKFAEYEAYLERKRDPEKSARRYAAFKIGGVALFFLLFTVPTLVRLVRTFL